MTLGGIGAALLGCNKNCRPTAPVSKLGFRVPPSYFNKSLCYSPNDSDYLLLDAVVPEMDAPPSEQEFFRSGRGVSILVRSAARIDHAEWIVSQANECAEASGCLGPSLVSSDGSLRIYSQRSGRKQPLGATWYAVEKLSDGTLWSLEEMGDTFLCWRRFGPVEVRYQFSKTVPLSIGAVDSAVLSLLKKLSVDERLRGLNAPNPSIERTSYRRLRRRQAAAHVER